MTAQEPAGLRDAALPDDPKREGLAWLSAETAVVPVLLAVTRRFWLGWLGLE